MYQQQIKKTLWERWFSPKIEEPKHYYNPLNIKYKSIVNINLVEYSGNNYLVKEIREVTRKINNNIHVYVDYIIGYVDFCLRLRIDNANKAAKILLLELTDDLIYNKEIHNICLKSTEFCVNEDGKESMVYWRIGDVKTTQNGSVTIIGNGERDKHFNIDYWDYSRLTKDEADQEYEEYLFVEMDKDSGRMQIWVGKEIDYSRVSIF